MPNKEELERRLRINNFNDLIEKTKIISQLTGQKKTARDISFSADGIIYGYCGYLQPEEKTETKLTQYK